MCSHFGRTVALVLAVAALALLAAGCGQGGPRTYPVAGKVVFKGKPGNMRHLIGAKVRLQSTSDPSIVAVGAIEDDGSFSLGTTMDKKSLSGVPAGAYKARLEPRRSDDPDAPPVVPFAAKYLDYDKSGLTVTVPADGEIVIEVERR
ncbi:MAG: hypothetical protein L0Y71_18765 [Gemmataceae bacterium]|nr:hypothetical protein [Gemmataceae bacterium]